MAKEIVIVVNEGGSVETIYASPEMKKTWQKEIFIIANKGGMIESIYASPEAAVSVEIIDHCTDDLDRLDEADAADALVCKRVETGELVEVY